MRRRAEEAEAAAAEELAHERELRLRTDEELRTRNTEAHQMDTLMVSLQAEHLAIEQEKARVEMKLQEARNEVRFETIGDLRMIVHTMLLASTCLIHTATAKFALTYHRLSGLCPCLRRRRRQFAKQRAWSASRLRLSTTTVSRALHQSWIVCKKSLIYGPESWRGKWLAGGPKPRRQPRR